MELDTWVAVQVVGRGLGLGLGLGLGYWETGLSVVVDAKDRLPLDFEKPRFLNY